MKPLDYSHTQQYGESVQAEQRANVYNPVGGGTSPGTIEQFWIQRGMEGALRSSQLGLQKEMFNSSMEERQRQFDISTEMAQSQFGSQMSFARDKFKQMRREDNRAELLGMANVGMSIGFGYLQYRNQKEQLRKIKLAQQYYAAGILQAKQKVT